jgi:molybdopterin converting factor small subunit
MSDEITIIPYGSLKIDTGAALSDKLVRPIAYRQPLFQFLETIGISGSRIQLAMINHRAAGLDTMVGAGDRVALFPREYPIFVDWHAFRHASAQPDRALK